MITFLIIYIYGKKSLFFFRNFLPVIANIALLSFENLQKTIKK